MTSAWAESPSHTVMTARAAGSGKGAAIPTDAANPRKEISQRSGTEKIASTTAEVATTTPENCDLLDRDTHKLDSVLERVDVTKGSIQLVEYAHDFYRTNKTLLKLMVTRGQSKTYLKVALHASLKLDMRAPDIYSNITAFMGDRPTQKSSGEVCTDILRHVLEFQEGRDHIRDEAFCQVLKQICGNNNPLCFPTNIFNNLIF